MCSEAQQLPQEDTFLFLQSDSRRALPVKVKKKGFSDHHRGKRSFLSKYLRKSSQRSTLMMWACLFWPCFVTTFMSPEFFLLSSLSVYCQMNALWWLRCPYVQMWMKKGSCFLQEVLLPFYLFLFCFLFVFFLLWLLLFVCFIFFLWG